MIVFGGNIMVLTFSKCGEYHKSRGESNQDSVLSAEDSRFLLTAVADGASSCSRAADGARTACVEIKNMFMKNGELFFGFDSDKIGFFAVSQIMYRLKKMANEENADVGDFASTLSFAFIDKLKRKMILFNLGDNMILSSAGGGLTIISKPACDPDGSCLTTSSTAYGSASVEKIDCNTLDSVLLLSDGAWKTVYERGMPKKKYEKLLAKEKFECMCRLLEGESCIDDCSFAAVNLKSMRLRGDL